MCVCAQNNVEAAESDEAEELLTDAPPWCYSEAGDITACSPVADRVLRSGIYELEAMPRDVLMTTHTRAIASDLNPLLHFSAGVAAS